MENMTSPKVSIIILNYNGWKDTIECLESVLRNDYPNYQVIVVDNNSSDNSIDCIKSWADGKISVWAKPDNPLRHLSYPPIERPIPYIFYTRKEAENGGIKELESQFNENDFKGTTTRYPLILTQSGDNLGFAGGNNVAIRYILAKNDSDYIWLLNNDTVIKKDSLSKLVEKVEFYKKENKKIGITGSKLFYYDRPNIINGVGGRYNKYLGVSKQIGVFEKDNGQYDNKSILKDIDYIIGASMFVSKEFIEDNGLMCEDYFLYFEELDWALRGQEKGYKLGYSWESIIYHKEGISIGSSSKGKEKSEFSDYWGLKNRLFFTKKFYPQYLWLVYISFVGVIFNRLIRGQFKRIKTILKIILNYDK